MTIMQILCVLLLLLCLSQAAWTAEKSPDIAIPLGEFIDSNIPNAAACVKGGSLLFQSPEASPPVEIFFPALSLQHPGGRRWAAVQPGVSGGARTRLYRAVTLLLGGGRG